MISTFLYFCIFWSNVCFAQEAFPSISKIDNIRLSTCEANGAQYDTDWLLVTDGNVARFQSTNGFYYLKSEGEKIYYSENSDFSSYKILFVEAYVKEALSLSQDLDIQVRFAFLNNQQYIYWNETYMHRRHMHGLLSFEQGELRFICNGLVGNTDSH